MRGRFCSVIVLPPGSPSTHKLHLSRGVIKIVISGLLVAVLAVIWMGRAIPTVDEASRTRLEAENQALKSEALSAAARIKTLDAKLSELEAQTRRINELVTPAPAPPPAD